MVNEQQLPRDRAPMAPERPVSLTGSAAMANDNASISQEVVNVPVVNEQQLSRDRAPMAPERPGSLTGSAAMANDDASIA